MHHLKSLPDELAKFAVQLLISARHSGFILDTDTLINSVIEELECLKNRCARSQRGQGEKQKEGCTDEALADTGSKGSRRRHHECHCYSCGKPGHWAHECCEPNEDATASTSDTPQLVSLPRPGTNWADWSDAMGREMYLRRALERLNFEYPSDDTA
jgi:hypothetical protein